MSEPLFWIDIPTDAPSYTASAIPMTLGGYVSAVDSPVVSVQWWNDATSEGGDGTVVGDRWSAIVPLQSGYNHVSAWATNAIGEIQGDSCGVTLTVPFTGVTVNWVASDSPGVVGYRIYCGSESGFYNEASSPLDVGNVTSARYPLPDTPATWYFAIVSYDGTGRESPFTAELVYTHPGAFTTIGIGRGTLRRVTGVARGTVTILGTHAVSLRRITGRGTGTVSPGNVVGLHAGTLQQITGAAVGEVIIPITGYHIGTLRRLTGAAAGTTAVSGTHAGTLRRLTSTATGTVGVTGTHVGALSRLTSSASGTVAATGEHAGTLQRLTGTGAGLVVGTWPVGTHIGTLQRITGSGAGRVGKRTGKPPVPPGRRVRGTHAGTLQRITGDGEGLVTFPEIDGVHAGTLLRLLGTGTGEVGAASVTGTHAGTLLRLLGAAEGLVTLPAITGAASGTLQRILGTAEGTVAAEDVEGVHAGSLQRLTGSAFGHVNAPVVIVTGHRFGLHWYELSGFLTPYWLSTKARKLAPVTPPATAKRGHPIHVDPGEQGCHVG